MQITTHRGTHEIGGNCVEIATDNSRIILDVGMSLFKSVGEPYDTGIVKRRPKQELLDSGTIVDCASHVTDFNSMSQRCDRVVPGGDKFLSHKT